MSGIVGLVRFDGVAQERQLLLRMTEAMAYRGPDGTALWCEGEVGFGHTSLATSAEQSGELQPITIDGQVWLVADARIDARDDLVAKMAAGRGTALSGASDAELILRAYLLWGEGCIDHLLGDFAFAVWDGPKRRLFCARDHFGVKLFYYVHAAHGFAFSNTIACLHAHPAISAKLNDQAIGDFLLFGYNRDLATTSFAEIQRLPPAHTLTIEPGGFQVKRYWWLAGTGELIRYRDAHEYVDHFKTLLAQAVRDRLRAPQIAILMSGGIDSTALAASACRIESQSATPAQIRAYCCVYEHAPDDERRYAQLAATRLGMPIEFLPADDCGLFADWGDENAAPPEPCDSPLRAVDQRLAQAMAGQSRVALFGEDGDALLNPSTVVEMLRAFPWRDVIADIARYWIRYRRRPGFGLGVMAQLSRLRGTRPALLFPDWLNPEFAHRCDLAERWHMEMNSEAGTRGGWRSRVIARLTNPLWQTLFESCDPGVTHHAIEYRLPLMDLRLIQFALAVPPLPWHENKHLLRLAMAGELPDEICRRPKTPLQFDPYQRLLANAEANWLDSYQPTPEVSAYVDWAKVPKITAGAPASGAAYLHLRAIALSHWLQRRAVAPITTRPR